MQRWGLSLIGILLIMCGLIYTVIPQKTPYQGISKAFLAHYLSGRGIGYMQLGKSSSLYIVNEGDYLPAFSADYLNHGDVLICSDKCSKTCASTRLTPSFVVAASTPTASRRLAPFWSYVRSTAEFTSSPEPISVTTRSRSPIK